MVNRVRGYPAPDPYQMYDNGSSYPTREDYFGNRTLSSIPDLTGRGIVLTVGQSLAGNSVNAAHTITNSGAVRNFSIWNGATYIAADPLLGCSSITDPSFIANYATVLGDDLITNGHYTNVLLVPISVDSTSVDAWQTGGIVNYRIGVIMRRLTSFALEPDWILWHQGETDALNGTSQSAYTASLNDVISCFRVFTDAPFLVALETWISGSKPAGATAVRAAQAAVVNHGNNVWAGADWDTMNNTYRHDTTHLNASGAAQASTLDIAAMDATGLLP